MSFVPWLPAWLQFAFCAWHLCALVLVVTIVTARAPVKPMRVLPESARAFVAARSVEEGPPLASLIRCCGFCELQAEWLPS